MLKRHPDHPQIFVTDYFGPHVEAAVSGRGYSKAGYPEFLKKVGIDQNTLYRVNQVHGSGVRVVDVSDAAFHTPQGDALVTEREDVALAVLTADCAPVFLFDPSTRSLGLAHAGWKGLREEVLARTVEKMESAFGVSAGDMKAFVGPCIHVCCYEVGSEFQLYFEHFFHPAKNTDKGYFDLPGAVKDQLVSAGLHPDLIRIADFCTSCRKDLFFSARAEKTDERILSVMRLI